MSNKLYFTNNISVFHEYETQQFCGGQPPFLKLKFLQYETRFNDFDCVTNILTAITYLEIAVLVI